MGHSSTLLLHERTDTVRQHTAANVRLKLSKGYLTEGELDSDRVSCSADNNPHEEGDRLLLDKADDVDLRCSAQYDF